MGKSTSVKREIRFQQWIQQVKEYNERSADEESDMAECFLQAFFGQTTFIFYNKQANIFISSGTTM